MGIEVLATARDHPSFNGDNGRERFFEKGDIIAVRPGGWQWGTKETLPDFVQISVGGIQYRAAERYWSQWVQTPDLSVDSFDTVIDTGVIRMTAGGPVAARGKGQLDRAAVEAFLATYGAINVRRDADDILFDWNVLACVTGSGLYYGEMNGGVFVPVTYNNPVHRINLSPPSEMSVNQALVLLLRAGADVVQTDGRQITFEITRDDIRQTVATAIRREFSRTVAKNRYAIPRNTVDNIIGNGGTGTANRNQFLNLLIDRAA